MLPSEGAAFVNLPSHPTPSPVLKTLSLSTWLEEKRVLVFLLAFSLAILPFSRSISAQCGLLMVVNLLVRGGIVQRFKEMRNSCLVGAWGAFLVWMVVGVFWSENVGQAWNDIGIAYPLLGIPLLLSVSPQLEQEDVDKVMWGMVTGSLAATILAAYGGWYVYSTFGKSDYFFYHNLVWLLDISSATYLSFYLIIPLILVPLYVYRNWKNLNRLILTALLFVLALLISVQFILSVRIILLTLLLITPLFLILLLRKRYSNRVSVFTTFSCVLLTAILAFSIPQLRERFLQIVNTDFELAFQHDYHDSDAGLNEVNYRLMIWRFSAESVQENWLLGVGTGDWPQELRARMVAAHVKDVAWGMNAHNQFVQAHLTLGIIGLILLLLPLALSVRSAWHQRNLAYLLCLFVFMASFMAECILLRMHGVLLFATVMGVLAFAPSRAANGGGR